MQTVDLARWGQRLEDLRRLVVHAKPPRIRKRFLAPHDIAAGSNATQVAAWTGRCDEVVLRWLHAYNDGDPDAVVYRHTGKSPLLTLESARSGRAAVRELLADDRTPLC